MSRRILPGSCLDDSSEFQNLPWLGRCACCVLLLCESRTKWYLVPDGKALVLIHEQQPLSVPQTRTVINRSFVIILEKLMPFSQKSVCRGEGEVICRKQDLQDFISIIASVLTLRTGKQAQPFAVFVPRVPSARSGPAGAQRRNFPHRESDQYGS